ncbi:MAG: hypothetical protein MJA28_06345 [Gammaproteobacteria bacterium]|nr:hypothetical protein [Gammaproteobacteria bacterium]
MISKTQAGSHDQPVDFRAYAVNLVFKEFKDNWPRKFLSIWKTPEEMTASKKQWMKSFQTTGWLTPELFQIGLTEVKREQWPPDNPAEFLKYCHVQPRSVGAPEPLVAFRKALMNCHAQNDMPRWGHKCVYWAAVRTGLSELCVKGEALREQFYDNYAHALDEHQALGPMPVAMLPKQRELPTVEERTLAAEWLHSIKGAL